MSESKDPIRLRRRKLANGTTSLYLDIYLNGKRTYEFLKMYLVPEQTRKDKVEKPRGFDPFGHRGLTLLGKIS